MDARTNIIEAIGYVIMIGIILGVILTSIWILIIALRGDPDFQDEDDREIFEHEYWNKKNKKPDGGTSGQE